MEIGKTQRSADVFAHLAQLGAHVTRMNRRSVLSLRDVMPAMKTSVPPVNGNDLRVRLANG